MGREVLLAVEHGLALVLILSIVIDYRCKAYGTLRFIVFCTNRNQYDVGLTVDVINSRKLDGL